ncbi:ion transporter [Methylomarinum sp. Ch1-1]|uniref:Ion transporter n=1 Tax=Methylomarinum roseum TaxID=3067653 RepID=A0AAU7NTV6_9GAMM|nr:ion transporter [Methylomarinum sp. Ch1-1]MDP4519535.1 ion transporter [Methylomarinum sp. Ch1-1]
MKQSRRPVKKNHYNVGAPLAPWREALNVIIFGAETRAAKIFDVVLSIMIICSVLAVMLGSVNSLQERYTQWFFYSEWFFTLLFSVEYVLRLLSVRKPWLYCRSFFGIVDFLSIIPTYLSFLMPDIKYMLIARVLRLLRVFRILKLAEYMGEAQVLMYALSRSRQKILVFLYTVCTLVIVFGSLMYVVEGSESGFTSIPKSVYWAIVTLTTVGYGDIAPQTPLGQMIASSIMIMGYGIIAVPTGIYSAELMKVDKAADINNEACPDCGETGHDYDASYCKYCGHSLDA